MRNFLQAVLLVTFGLLSPCFAESSDITITPFENVNILCASTGSLIAISEQDQQFWLGDPGIPNQGLKYQTTAWDKFRCIHCFNGTGTMEWNGINTTAKIFVTYDGPNQPLKLTYQLMDQDGTEIVVINPEEFNCQFQK